MHNFRRSKKCHQHYLFCPECSCRHSHLWCSGQCLYFFWEKFKYFVAPYICTSFTSFNIPTNPILAQVLGYRWWVRWFCGNFTFMYLQWSRHGGASLAATWSWNDAGDLLLHSKTPSGFPVCINKVLFFWPLTLISSEDTFLTGKYILIRNLFNLLSETDTDIMLQCGWIKPLWIWPERLTCLIGCDEQRMKTGFCVLSSRVRSGFPVSQGLTDRR